MKNTDPLFSMAQELRKLKTELARYSDTGSVAPALSIGVKAFTLALTYGNVPMTTKETFGALNAMAAFGKLKCLEFLNANLSVTRKSELAALLSSLLDKASSAPPGQAAIGALLPELEALEQAARARAAA
jgi:hypothetical protein